MSEPLRRLDIEQWVFEVPDGVYTFPEWPIIEEPQIPKDIAELLRMWKLK